MIIEERKEGGFSWVVVAAAFIIQFVAFGINYSIGLLQLEFSRIFSNDVYLVSWLPATLFFFTTVSGLLAKLIVYLTGSLRVPVISGGVMATTGLSLCMLIPMNVTYLILLVGVLTGTGLGLTYLPSLMAIERHFLKKRKRAIGFALSGMGIGLIVFGFAIPILFEHYSWRGALLLLGGCCFHLVLAGVCLISPSSIYPRYLPRVQKRALSSGFGCGSSTCCKKDSDLENSSSPVSIRQKVDFVVLCVAYSLFALGSTIVYVYIPGYAFSLTFSTLTESGILIVFIGIASLISRLFFTVVGHSSKLDIAVSFLCTVVGTLLCTLLHHKLFLDYAGQIAFCMFFGIFVGFWTTQSSHFVEEFVGSEFSVRVSSWLLIVTAVSTLAGVPLAGIIVRNYAYSRVFDVACGCLVAASCLMFVCKCVPMNSRSPMTHNEKQ